MTESPQEPEETVEADEGEPQPYPYDESTAQEDFSEPEGQS